MKSLILIFLFASSFAFTASSHATEKTHTFTETKLLASNWPEFQYVKQVVAYRTPEKSWQLYYGYYDGERCISKTRDGREMGDKCRVFKNPSYGKSGDWYAHFEFYFETSACKWYFNL